MSDPSRPAHSSDPFAASLPADGSDTPTSLEQQGTQDPAPHADPDAGTTEPDDKGGVYSSSDNPEAQKQSPDEVENQDPSATPEAGVTLPAEDAVDPEHYASKEYAETHGHNPLEQNRGDYA